MVTSLLCGKLTVELNLTVWFQFPLGGNGAAKDRPINCLHITCVCVETRIQTFFYFVYFSVKECINEIISIV